MPMYAVIKTGGKQYRVKPGDVLVVEKLPGDSGAEVAFDQVLMLGEGADVTVGAPLVDGALVKATLVETRRGEKVKIFKKIRRQGYRRTRGHRQSETVLRVTSIAGAGKSEAWDGAVDLTPLSILNAKARGLRSLVTLLEAERAPAVAETPAKPARAKTAKAPAVSDEEAIHDAAIAGAPIEAVDETATDKPAAKPRAKKAKPSEDGQA
jgi:large subunit ribosomal protein L21